MACIQVTDFLLRSTRYCDKAIIFLPLSFIVASSVMLKYQQLIAHPDFRRAWTHSAANEFGRLFQGVGDRIKNPTNTCFFIHKADVPVERFKDVTYGKFECTERAQKAETLRKTQRSPRRPQWAWRTRPKR